MFHEHTLSFFLDPPNVSLPECPSPTSNITKALTDAIAYPSVTFTYMFLAVVSLIFATVIGFRYNSVPVNVVKEKKGTITKTETVRKKSVSNTLWVLYFFSLCLRSSFDSVRFSLYRNTDAVLDDALTVGSLILFGASVFALTLALEHQRAHRSHFKKKDQKSSINSDVDLEFSAMRETIKKMKKIVFLLGAPLALLILYFFGIGAYFVQSTVYFYVWMAFYILQRLPIIILTLFIVFNTNDGQNGPSTISRIILVVAVILNLLNEIPITIWSYIFLVEGWYGSNPCLVGGFASLVDVLHLLYAISQILFFIFLRAEFKRNEHPCVWEVVSKRHEGYFDFHEFEDSDKHEQPQTEKRPTDEYSQLFKKAYSYEVI